MLSICTVGCSWSGCLWRVFCSVSDSLFLIVYVLLGMYGFFFFVCLVVGSDLFEVLWYLFQ